MTELANTVARPSAGHAGRRTTSRRLREHWPVLALGVALLAGLAAPLATGSIASPPIAFGAPVVTPSPTLPFAVQLAASHSLETIRQSWSQLRERHAASLAALEPHVVPPRADGSGHYRLVAGPLPTRADAERLCTELGVGRQGCFATTFIGQPL